MIHVCVHLCMWHCEYTLSVPWEFATTWVTRGSNWLVHSAPNCSAVCHNGWRWGLASPTGNTLLKTTLHPARIFLCSAASIFLTSTSFKEWWQKKFRWILSITWVKKRHNIILGFICHGKPCGWQERAQPQVMMKGFHRPVSHHHQSQEGKAPEAQTDACC